MSTSHLLDCAADEANLHAAWDRVASNRGCAGADGVRIGDIARDFQETLFLAREALQSGYHQPFPLLDIPIPKPDGRLRHLAVPTVFDRLVQTALHHALTPVLEPTFEEESFAYRPHRGWQDALRRVRDLRDRGYRWVYDADVVGYFDHVNHDHLLEVLARALPEEPLYRLLRRLIRAEVWDGASVRPLEAGIPQGSPLSPLFANLYLDSFDELLQSEHMPHVRFADDFLVFFRSERDAEEGAAIVDAAIESLHLEMHRSKTRIASFRQGIRFLGAICTEDAVMVPLGRKDRERTRVQRPPVLTIDMLRALRLPALAWPGSGDPQVSFAERAYRTAIRAATPAGRDRPADDASWAVLDEIPFEE